MTLAQAAIATLLGSTLPGAILLSMRAAGILASPTGRNAAYRSRLRSAASASACVAAGAAAASAATWGGGWTGAAVTAGAIAIGATTIALACSYDLVSSYSDEARAVITEHGSSP